MSNNIDTNNQIQQIAFFNSPLINYKIDLPRELVILIFEHLGNLELVQTISMVCQSWKSVASEDYLWKRWVIELEVPQNRIKEGKTQEEVIKKIKECKSWIKQSNSDPAQFLLSASYPVLTLSSEEDGEKARSIETIKNYFDSFLLLSRIGVLEKEEKTHPPGLNKKCPIMLTTYASLLQIEYKEKYGWEKLVEEFIRKNDLQEAEFIFQTYLSKFEKSYYSVLKQLIDFFLKKSDWDKASQFFIQHWGFPDQIPRKNQKDLIKAFREFGHPVYSYLMKTLKEKKQLIALERIITHRCLQIFYTNHVMQVIQLIKLFLKEKDQKKAKELIEKYSPGWEKDLKNKNIAYFSSYASLMIPIYFETNNYSQAWKLALQDSTENKGTLRLLHELFVKANLVEWAERVAKQFK